MTLVVSKLKVAQLKSELAARNLPTSGLKAALAQRLQEAIDQEGTQHELPQETTPMVQPSTANVLSPILSSSIKPSQKRSRSRSPVGNEERPAKTSIRSPDVPLSEDATQPIEKEKNRRTQDISDHPDRLLDPGMGSQDTTLSQPANANLQAGSSHSLTVASNGMSSSPTQLTSTIDAGDPSLAKIVDPQSGKGAHPILTIEASHTHSSSLSMKLDDSKISQSGSFQPENLGVIQNISKVESTSLPIPGTLLDPTATSGPLLGEKPVSPDGTVHHDEEQKSPDKSGSPFLKIAVSSPSQEVRVPEPISLSPVNFPESNLPTQLNNQSVIASASASPSSIVPIASKELNQAGQHSAVLVHPIAAKEPNRSEQPSAVSVHSTSKKESNESKRRSSLVHPTSSEDPNHSQPSFASSAQPGATQEPTQLAQTSSAYPTESSDTHRPPVTSSLYISNLVRPLTVPQIKKKLSEFGDILSFWIDSVRSHVYVTFTDISASKSAYHALHQTTPWPPETGKILTLLFVPTQQVPKLIKEEEENVNSGFRRGRLELCCERSSEGDEWRFELRSLTGSGLNRPRGLASSVPIGLNLSNTPRSTVNRENLISNTPAHPEKLSPIRLDFLKPDDNPKGGPEKWFKKTKTKPHLFWTPAIKSPSGR